MLLMNPIKDAGGRRIFGQCDGGYYLDGKEIRRAWGGALAPMLGLTGDPRLSNSIGSSMACIR